MRTMIVLISAMAEITFGIAGFAAKGAGPQRGDSVPQYTAQNQLMRPQNYREWIYLSSGLGMAYSPNPKSAPIFTNVFVTPEAYRKFVATGTWPEKTMFVLEEREASSKGSINQGGHYQTELRGIAASVKDSSRFPTKWAYFNFGLDEKSASPNPPESCWNCHNAHGAVDNTFVQFYPTLKPIAMKFGTYKPKESGTEP
jgi:hypothetical protein